MRIPNPAARGPAAAEDARLRLMIVDDSAVARAILSRMISAFPEFEVVALAANATEALDELRATRVDIVLLDVEMPGSNGIDALPEILRIGQGARVLIVSSNCEDGAESAVKTLALGAADTLPKPGTVNFAGRFAEVLAERLRRIGEAARAELECQRDQVAPSLRPLPTDRPACLALGASTGGLHALNAFFAALPPRIHVPILITQHLPSVFMPFFARQIAAVSGRSAQVAGDGLRLQADEVIVAPGEAHLGLRRHGNTVTVELIAEPAQSGCLPSVDTMLSSFAAVYGRNGLAVIFSGMGRDGLAGSAELVGEGGVVVVQDQRSSSVWGMPRVVADAGLASAVLSPHQLAECISAVIGGGAWK